MPKRFLVAFALCATLRISSAAAASIVYSNGPTNGAIGGQSINFGQAIANSFTLAEPAIITGFSFGGNTFAGDTITSVNFGLSSLLDFPSNMTALTAGPLIASPEPTFDVRNYTASFSAVYLTAGTYYFSLQNAATVGSSLAFWDVNNGPSMAFSQSGGMIFPFSNSEAFTLTSDSVPAVPEPATWAMMLLGFGGIGAEMRRRRRPSAVRIQTV